MSAEKIPADKQYLYRKQWWPLNGASSSLAGRIGDCLDDLKAIQSRVLFIIARAGQGKTNFVCDFAENVLLKRSIPCLFFTGRELNYFDPDKIDEHMLRSALGRMYGDGIDTALKNLETLSLTDHVPVVIIIDGINEHADLASFSYQLERVVEEFLKCDFFKIILTCRSEYFDQRFRNFAEASFANDTYFVENLERYTSDTHKEHLIQAYFDFFKLRCPYLSQSAREALERDTLLLRMFCEAYGDHSAEKEIYLPQVMDIYKDEIFRIYLERKLTGAAQHHADDSRLVGVSVRYKKVLSDIIQLMIERSQYSNIPVADLPHEDYEPLEEMLGEDIVFRKDLVEGMSVLDEKSEVINFTFDEFRDFLIADLLVMDIFKKDSEKFRNIIDRLTAPMSPVAEGVRKFVFFASKHPESQQVLSIIAESSWYKEVFLEGIFSVQEEFITQDDLRAIESRFFEDARNSEWIIISLVRRYRTDAYKILNINLLLQILDKLDESAYDRLVRPAFRSPGLYGFPWLIEQLTNWIHEILAEPGTIGTPYFETLMELLIRFFDIQGREYTLPAFEVFRELADVYPDAAMGLLERHTEIHNKDIAEHVWNMLTHLSRRNKMSHRLVEKGYQVLKEFSDVESVRVSHLTRAVALFLISCRDSMQIELPNDVSPLIEEIMTEWPAWRLQ